MAATAAGVFFPVSCCWCPMMLGLCYRMFAFRVVLPPLSLLLLLLLLRLLLPPAAPYPPPHPTPHPGYCLPRTSSSAAGSTAAAHDAMVWCICCCPTSAAVSALMLLMLPLPHGLMLLLPLLPLCSYHDDDYADIVFPASTGQHACMHAVQCMQWSMHASQYDSTSPKTNADWSALSCFHKVKVHGRVTDMWGCECCGVNSIAIRIELAAHMRST